jgi:hypothetical protein
MLSAQTAINRYQRDVTLSLVVRGLLLAGLVASVLVLPIVFRGFDATLGLSLVFGVWLILSFTSAKNSRILGPSSELIARGQFEEAEQRIDQATRAFSLSRASKLLGLHHLAVLRHKQRQYQDAATLCRAVLGQRAMSVAMPGLDRATRLMLADTLLELGDFRGAGDAIMPLRAAPLGLAEQITLLGVELDVMSRTGAWDAMLVGLPGKVQLAELMPPQAAARVQAMLALAAAHRGHADWADWLRRRVELLADVGKLSSERPVLWELWQRKEQESGIRSQESV